MPDPGSVPFRVTALSLNRGSANLGPISFTLPSPGCWWLSGVSGSGKSLLMEALAGFHAEARGSIRVGGDEISHCAPERRSIALMPQRWKLFPHWSVARNLRFAAHRARQNTSRLTNSGIARTADLTRRLEVSHLLHRPAHALSGGETQRIVLIQTLLTAARILLLDEPLSAIDATLQSAVLNLLQEECKESQRICLIAVHKPIAGHPMDGVFNIEEGMLSPAGLPSATRER
jgi:ABC-type sugar transport system ATPase subunit